MYIRSEVALSDVCRTAQDLDSRFIPADIHQPSRTVQWLCFDRHSCGELGCIHPHSAVRVLFYRDSLEREDRRRMPQCFQRSQYTEHCHRYCDACSSGAYSFATERFIRSQTWADGCILGRQCVSNPPWKRNICLS